MVVSAWLMWVKDELLRGRGSREACAEMEDIAGGAREERGLCGRIEGFLGGSGDRTGDAEDTRTPKFGADRLWRNEASGGDDVLSC